MRDALISILGPYTPDLTAEGLAQVDWPWVLSAVLVIAVIVSLMRFIGGVFRAK